MSFWDLSDGGSANENTQTSYEVSGGMDPIPNNSDVLAEIEEVKWEHPRDDTSISFINVKWRVHAPYEVKNRVVFHKLWVDSLDPQAESEGKAKEKRDKARRMLATIDANVGGKLARSAEAPKDDDLALALVGAKMVIKCMVWEMPDKKTPGAFISGNWISAVKEKTAELFVSSEKPKPSAPKASNPQNNNRGFDLDGDEIPW